MPFEISSACVIYIITGNILCVSRILFLRGCFNLFWFSLLHGDMIQFDVVFSSRGLWFYPFVLFSFKKTRMEHSMGIHFTILRVLTEHRRPHPSSNVEDDFLTKSWDNEFWVRITSQGFFIQWAVRKPPTYHRPNRHPQTDHTTDSPTKVGYLERFFGQHALQFSCCETIEVRAVRNPFSLSAAQIS